MSKVGDALVQKLKSITPSKIEVTKTPENKEPKLTKAGIPAIGEYYHKPILYLDNKDFPGVKNFKGGDEVYLVIKAKVINHNVNETTDEKGKKVERIAADLEVLEIADITNAKGGK